MESDLNDLLRKWKTGNCTSADLIRLRKYFTDNKLQALEDEMYHEWSQTDFNQTENHANLKQRIYSASIAQQRKNKREFLVFWGRAAVILIVVGIAIGLWYSSYLQDEIGSFTETTYYNSSNEPKQYILNDGTKVWLKPYSTLTLDKDFSPQNRNLILNGGARFDVASDEFHPFQIQTEEIMTKVLGTEFNISAYSKDTVIQVSLFEGKIKIALPLDDLSQIELFPGESIEYNKRSKQHDKSPIENYAQFQWKEGYLYFQKTYLDLALKEIGQWYNITIHIDHIPLKNERLVHKIDTRKLNVTEVLQGISMITDYHFEKIAANEYIVKKNKMPA